MSLDPEHAAREGVSGRMAMEVRMATEVGSSSGRARREILHHLDHAPPVAAPCRGRSRRVGEELARREGVAEAAMCR
jgi:hypothetical protein